MTSSSTRRSTGTGCQSCPPSDAVRPCRTGYRRKCRGLRRRCRTFADDPGQVVVPVDDRRIVEHGAGTIKGAVGACCCFKHLHHGDRRDEPVEHFGPGHALLPRQTGCEQVIEAGILRFMPEDSAPPCLVAALRRIPDNQRAARETTCGAIQVRNPDVAVNSHAVEFDQIKLIASGPPSAQCILQRLTRCEAGDA